MAEYIKMLAFDFGASSGRAILGKLYDNKLEFEEIHRFSNDPVSIRGSLYWDVLRLFYEIKKGILKCVNSGHKNIASLAVDTWGVDFGLLDGKGNLIGNPYHYRDSRTEGMIEEVSKIMPMKELYSKTGIQLMAINTLFQLFSMKHSACPQLSEAKTLLLMPDLFNYFLTGIKSTEYSIASTTQMLDPYKREWSKEIIKKLGLPESLFTQIVPSGTVIGKLSKEIADELGCEEIPVISTASHDTQSAIASVPSTEKNYVYISCGTWSLMGVELDKPVINEKSESLSFTNEGGVDNKISFMKNIMGLWLVQECKRQWDREGDSLSFAELESLANSSIPFKCFVDPDHESFVSPGDMPRRIREFCKNTNQYIPESKGEIVRCIAESLAMKYRHTVESLEEILGKKLDVIHMVGGGIKDKMLCRFTASSTGRKVIAGPVEATAAGNLIIQAMALGRIKNLAEAREIIRNSFSTTVYMPESVETWSEAYLKYRKVIEQ